jgi:hypothetical protein
MPNVVIVTTVDHTRKLEVKFFSTDDFKLPNVAQDCSNDQTLSNKNLFQRQKLFAKIVGLRSLLRHRHAWQWIPDKTQ